MSGLEPLHKDGGQAGQTILHYTIVEKLGEGGMGVVYKAHDTKLDRFVALKFLPPSLVSSPEEVARFEREAKAISALNHPNIAVIYDINETPAAAGLESKQKFLVLEYIAGGTLKDAIKKLKAANAEMEISRLVEYGIGIAEGLAHAHRQQIVHRDIKSDNIMLTADGVVKITDFGLAKLRGNLQLTRTGSTIGTLAYMAPEQLRGEEIDSRADLFSLGVVLYELATTRLPFRGEHEAAMMYSIANEEPVPITSVRKDVPAALEQIISKALQKDQNARYQRAEEISADLKSLQGGSGPVALPSARLQTKPGNSLKRRLRIPIAIAAAVVLILAGVLLYVFRPAPQPAAAVNKSIAVLPFANLSGDQENEYFSDGITEDIITQLAKIVDLKVISRTSVMQYKKTDKTLKEIGKELGVSTVLEGSVQRSGNKMRIVADLVDINTEQHLWENTFDRELKDIFAVQDEITGHIVSSLTLTLSGTEQKELASSGTVNPKAHDLYLQGMFFLHQATQSGCTQAIELFQKALQEDSTYSEPYAGIAFAWESLADAYMPPHETYPKARIAALKALELDSTNGSAECALGLVYNQYEWNWQGGEVHMLRALRFAPNSQDVNFFYALTAMDHGDTAAAFLHANRAMALDPRSALASWMDEWLLLWARRYDDAIAQHQHTASIDPNFFYLDDMYAAALRMKGRYDESVAQYAADQKVQPGVPFYGLALTYARMGRTADARNVLDAVIEESKKRYVAADMIACVYAQLGDNANALKYLQKAFDDHSAGVMFVMSFPDYDALRAVPGALTLWAKYIK